MKNVKINIWHQTNQLVMETAKKEVSVLTI